MKRSSVFSITVRRTLLFLTVLCVPTSSLSTSVTDCVLEGSYVSFTGESNNTDASIQVPGGSLFLTLTASVTRAIPTDVILVKLVTRDRDNAIVPCLDGVSGSCVFDMCNFFEFNPELISPPFTSCPISPDTYTIQTESEFDELWLPINGDMQNVTYTTRYELQSDQETIGCFEYQFSLTTKGNDAIVTRT